MIPLAPGMRGKSSLPLLLLIAVAGCGKCTQSTTATPGVERVLPRGAVGVVVIPALGAAGQKLRILEALKVTAFAAQLRGFDDGKGLADALVSELGIDVRSTQALEKAGVDPAGSAGVAALVTGHGYLALPVKDATKFHNTLQTHATQMAPAARGTAVALFAFCLFMGQAIGVSVAGYTFDNVGAAPLLLAPALALPLVGWGFARALRRRQQG